MKLSVDAEDVLAVAGEGCAPDETIERLERHVRALRNPYSRADRKDWEWLMAKLGDGGHGQFWKDVMTEVYGALEFTKGTTSPAALGSPDAKP